MNYLANKNLEMQVTSKYSMVLAASPKEIVTEGSQQSNCVGGYVNSVAKGEDIILFLRKSDDINKSWVTVELQNRNDKLSIVQTYATYNNSLDQEQKIALATWAKYAQVELGNNVFGLSSLTPAEFRSLAKTTQVHGEISEDIHQEAVKEYEKVKADRKEKLQDLGNSDIMKMKQAS